MEYGSAAPWKARVNDLGVVPPRHRQHCGTACDHPGRAPSRQKLRQLEVVNLPGAAVTCRKPTATLAGELAMIYAVRWARKQAHRETP
jgi:hypothetical protein